MSLSVGSRQSIASTWQLSNTTYFSIAFNLLACHSLQSTRQRLTYFLLHSSTAQNLANTMCQRVLDPVHAQASHRTSAAPSNTPQNPVPTQEHPHLAIIHPPPTFLLVCQPSTLLRHLTLGTFHRGARATQLPLVHGIQYSSQPPGMPASAQHGMPPSTTHSPTNQDQLVGKAGLRFAHASRQTRKGCTCMYVTRSMSMEWTSNFSARQPASQPDRAPLTPSGARSTPTQREVEHKRRGTSGRLRPTCLLFGIEQWVAEVSSTRMTSARGTPPRPATITHKSLSALRSGGWPCAALWCAAESGQL
ncbi:hypothetical protein HDK77DRAFT_132992 [Phyllosticta capitalensis]